MWFVCLLFICLVTVCMHANIYFCIAKFLLFFPLPTEKGSVQWWKSFLIEKSTFRLWFHVLVPKMQSLESILLRSVMLCQHGINYLCNDLEVSYHVCVYVGKRILLMIVVIYRLLMIVFIYRIFCLVNGINSQLRFLWK